MSGKYISELLEFTMTAALFPICYYAQDGLKRLVNGGFHSEEFDGESVRTYIDRQYRRCEIRKNLAYRPVE